MTTVADRWRSVLERVENACAKVNRNPSEVGVIAVTKAVTIESVAEAIWAGARFLGENYVQEALPKMEALKTCPGADKVQWHFVGSLQSNKAKQVAGRFSLIHSLDRWSLAKELAKAPAPARALIEVNVAGEGTKSGLPPGELKAFAERVSAETAIEVSGLMVFPPLAVDPEASRPYFARAREMAAEMESWGLPRVTGKVLSMGISSDFEAAVQEGATLVRIGTAIFGARD